MDIGEIGPKLTAAGPEIFGLTLAQLRRLKVFAVTPLEGTEVSGTLSEFKMEGRGDIGIARSVIHGKWPVGGKEYVRSTEADEYYFLERGKARVTVEGENPVELREGEWMKMERGSWYKGEFENAEFWIVTNPPWTQEQEELK